MLVLQRGPGEGILIGDNIVLTIVHVRGDKVRIGIEAPANIAVHRAEVYAAIAQANQSASGIAPADTAEVPHRHDGQ